MIYGWMDAGWVDGWMDGPMNRWTERQMISGGFIVVIQDKGISGRRWGWGKRADNSSGSLLLLPQLRDGHDPLLRLLLTPQSLMAAPGRWQQQPPTKSSTQEMKRTKGMCWQGWRPCPLRGVNGFPAPTGSKSTSFHSKSTANEKQILWLWPQL